MEKYLEEKMKRLVGVKTVCSETLLIGKRYGYDTIHLMYNIDDNRLFSMGNWHNKSEKWETTTDCVVDLATFRSPTTMREIKKIVREYLESASLAELHIITGEMLAHV